mmetsp:Transcript_4323/g.9060  ORF Transcript_4323/g.9060 Transcript_4323/m.9060 type:complete len:201 (+) Transcript_4323:1004-1606(+)
MAETALPTGKILTLRLESAVAPPSTPAPPDQICPRRPALLRATVSAPLTAATLALAATLEAPSSSRRSLWVPTRRVAEDTPAASLTQSQTALAKPKPPPLVVDASALTSAHASARLKQTRLRLAAWPPATTSCRPWRTEASENSRTLACWCFVYDDSSRLGECWRAWYAAGVGPEKISRALAPDKDAGVPVEQSLAGESA